MVFADTYRHGGAAVVKLYIHLEVTTDEELARHIDGCERGYGFGKEKGRRWNSSRGRLGKLK